MAGQQPSMQLQARSNEDSAIVVTNTDEADVVDGPVIEVAKSLSEREGRSPAGPLTVTLEYRNASDQTATDIVIEDILPTVTVNGATGGMTYVADSARWSQTGSTVLTDDEDGNQGNTPDLMDYCAYDEDATNPDCHDRVRARVAQLPPGGMVS